MKQMGAMGQMPGGEGEGDFPGDDGGDDGGDDDDEGDDDDLPDLEEVN